MASTFMNKLYGIFGKEKDEDFEEEDSMPVNDFDYEDDDEGYEEPGERGFFGSRRSKVVNINQAQQVKMIISKQLVH